MTDRRVVRPSLALLIFGMLLLCGPLFAQTSGFDNLSNDQKNQLLQALQNAGIAVPSAPAPTPSQQLPSYQTPSTVPQPTPVQPPAVPQPASSIEAMFSTRLPPNTPPLLQYGYDFFQRQPGSQFPAVGDDYVVGPGDVLALYLWGDAVDVAGLQSQYQLQVDRNGQGFFGPVGSFSASGLDLRSIREYLRSALTKKYKKFDLNITLGQMRTFPVYVSGFVNSPGPVMATAVDSVFYVIAGAGGVSKTGSLRNIILNHRGENQGTSVDLYDVLVFGKSTDLQVREGDSIWVPQVGPVAAVAGAVKRPAVYELKREKAVSDLIALAGGLLPSADASGASVVRFEGDQRRFIDGSTASRDVKTLELKDGDLVRVDSVRDYVFNQVQVEGEIRYPGSYSIERVSTLHALLDVAQMLPDSDMTYARVYRVADGGLSRNFTFLPRDVLDGKFDVPLKGRDRIVFYTFGQNLQFVDFDAFPDTVTLEGDIRYPGMYAWKEGFTLRSILTMDNFLVDTNVIYASILRQRTGSDAQSIVTFSPLDVAEGRGDVQLAPMDRVRFYPKTLDRPIEVSGLVKEAKILVYYTGIDLVDVLRVVTPAGDPDRMKVYVYREARGASQAAEQLAATQTNEAAAAGGYTGANQIPEGPGVAPPVGSSVTPAAAIPAGVIAPGTNVYQPGTAPGSTALQAAASTAAGTGTNAPGMQQQGAPSAAAQQQGTTQGAAVPSGAAATPPTPAPQPTRFVVYLRDILKTQTANQVPLQPGDRVVFALTEDNEKNPQITVRGEVLNAGALSFTEGMHLSDALSLAGGYAPGAYPQGIVLLRQSVAALQSQQLNRAAKALELAMQQNIEQSVSNLASVSGAASTSTITLQIQAQQAQLQALRSQLGDVLGRISIAMPGTITELRGSPADILLDDGDSIYIPRTPTSVQIFGEVYNPTTVAFRPGLKIRDYIAVAGGSTDNADLRASYVIHADGTTGSQKQRPLFSPPNFTDDLTIAGDTIIVAKKQVTPDTVLPIITSVAQIIASLANAALAIWAIVK